MTLTDEQSTVIAYVLVAVVALAGTHCLLWLARRYLLKPLYHRLLAALPPYY